MNYENSREFALEMDRQDPLASYRDLFHIPQTASGEERIYFCGNSLGLQPRSTDHHVDQVLQRWKTLAVEGFSRSADPWLAYVDSLKPAMAGVVGASTEEITLMNALTVNLHLMLISFYRPTSHRYKVLVEHRAFPSDQYAIKSQIRFRGFNPEQALIEVYPREGEFTIRKEDIIAQIDEQGDTIALILLGGVNYFTGQVFDMKCIAQKAREKGCIVGYDLAHAVGNVPLRLHDWQVDFAVWCNYKYLNGGPGSVGGCFVHQKYVTRVDLPRFASWWGNDPQTRFLMSSDFEPTAGADGWQLSNPPILSQAPLRASLKIFDEVGMVKIREKSLRLTGFLEFLIQEIRSPEITIITPHDPQSRGCQLSLKVSENNKSIFNRLISSGIVCDWREPDVIRVAPVPLYNSYIEVFRFVEILKSCLNAQN